jgi:hypothetical protein
MAQVEAESPQKTGVFLETGKRRTFAGATKWPGWCRRGRDEPSALQALIEYGPRYARVANAARLELTLPTLTSELVVVERVEGNATTDFGAPNVVLTRDSDPIGDSELQRFQQLLVACWETFDAAVRAARGTALRKGPRGGGRTTEGIVHHLLDSDAAYLAAVGRKHGIEDSAAPSEQLGQTREAILDALVSSAHGEIPSRGPRGGRRWTPRYFVRRLAWHALDHAWEIEDRAR